MLVATVLNSVQQGKENLVRRDSALFLRTIVCIAVSMPFTIFIHGLNKRFAALNSLLRFCIFFLIEFTTNDFCHIQIVYFFRFLFRLNQKAVFDQQSTKGVGQHLYQRFD